MVLERNRQGGVQTCASHFFCKDLPLFKTLAIILFIEYYVNCYETPLEVWLLQ